MCQNNTKESLVRRRFRSRCSRIYSYFCRIFVPFLFGLTGSKRASVCKTVVQEHNTTYILQNTMISKQNFDVDLRKHSFSLPFSFQSLKSTCTSVGLVVIALCAGCHQALTHLLIYPVFRLLFGTLYPAYASYKAVRTKNVKEYVSIILYFLYFIDCYITKYNVLSICF